MTRGLLGTHWLADATGCRADLLSDPDVVAGLLADLAAQAGLTALGDPLVRSTEAGLVGVLLLAESHASVHTDHAEASAFVDVFSCATLDPSPLEARVVDALAATRVTTRVVPRGPA